MLNVQHKTITWHVDDLNVSYKNPFQVTMFVCYMATIYELEFKVRRGNVHNYLGMDTDFLRRYL